MKKKIFAIGLLFYLLTLFTPQVSLAYAGFLDTGINPVEAGAEVSTSISGGITAGSSITTSIMEVLHKVKEYGLDGIAWYAAKKVVQNLTGQTVNWINSGFKGNPSYVQDPGKFFLNIADNEMSGFLSGPQLRQLCTPFQAKVRLALVQNYLREDKQNYVCTLGKLKDNYENFLGDFRQGGWDAWLEVTQNPQNNPIGSYLAAQNDAQKTIAASQGKTKTELSQGRGFLTFKKCPENSVVTAANQDQYSAEFKKKLNIGDCLVEPKSVTPGSVIETNLEKALGSSIDQLNLADSFNEIVGALISQVYSRVVGGGGGNGGLYSASSGNALSPNSLSYQLLNSDSKPTDSGGPSLILNGANTITVRLGYLFKDPGAIAYDTLEGDLTETIVKTNDSDSVVTATCDFDPFLKALASADAARKYNAVALTRWQDSADKNDRGRLGDLSNSAREVTQYFSALLKQSSILNPLAPEVDTLKRRIGGIILPAEQLINEAALPGMAANGGLSKGYTAGKVMEATLPLRKPPTTGAGLMDDIYNTFFIIKTGIQTNPALYCALNANPPIGDKEGVYTILYTVTNAQGQVATTTRTVIVSATAPIGQNDTPIDTLVGGDEIPDNNGQCILPADGGSKHGNHTAEVAAAKASLNLTLVVPGPNATAAEWQAYECLRWEITNAAVKLIPGAMLYPKAAGTACNGSSVDTIAFADGYLYDVLSGGAADGAGPQWNNSGPCGSGPTPTPACQTPPTPAQRVAAQAQMDMLLNDLNSAANLALCPQVPAPASAACQAAAQNAVNAVNSAFPGAAALYYVGENTIGNPFTYEVGPNTATVSNIIGPGNTWRGTFRVFCQ